MQWQEIIFGAISVIGIIEWLKQLDPENKLKKFYKFLPILVSAIPAVLISHSAGNFIWSSILLNLTVIFSFSTLGYQAIVETIEKRIKNS